MRFVCLIFALFYASNIIAIKPIDSLVLEQKFGWLYESLKVKLWPGLKLRYFGYDAQGKKIWFDGDEVKRLKYSALGKLSELDFLAKLNLDQFSDTKLSDLGNFKNLEEISLRGHNFADALEGFLKASCATLTKIDLSHTDLDTIPDFLVSMPNLQECVIDERLPLYYLDPAKRGFAARIAKICPQRIDQLIENYSRYLIVAKILKKDCPKTFRDLCRSLIAGKFNLTRENMTNIQEVKFIVGSLDQIFKECTWLREVNLVLLGLTTLPESLFELKSLSMLELQWNNLSAIPEGLQRVQQNLLHVDLNNNPIRTVPLWVKEKKNLRFFVYHNDIQELPPELEKWANQHFGYIPKIAAKWVENYKFAEQNRARADIVDALMAGQSIKVVAPYRNNLVRGVFDYEDPGHVVCYNESDPEVKDFLTKNLAEIFKKCPWIKCVTLNNLTALDKIPDEIAGLTELEELNLHNLKITSLPASLAKLTKLRTIKTTNLVLKDLAPELRKLGADLLHLNEDRLDALIDAYEVRMREERLDALLGNTTVWVRQQLREGILDGRLGFGEDLEPVSLSDGAKKFLRDNLSALLGAFKGLTHINLSGLQMTHLPFEILSMTQCQTLVLSDNYLTDLPEGFEQLGNLKNLVLSGNKFTVFPEIVTLIPGLRGLTLSSNFLTSVPESIAKLKQLRLLALDENLLRDLPGGLFKLVNLSQLHLNKNQLTGFRPKFPVFNELRNLLHLDLADNQIRVCPELDDLTGLAELHLEQNYMTYVDPTILDLNLCELNLDGNPLMGDDRSGFGVGFVRLQQKFGDKFFFDHHRQRVDYPSEDEVYLELRHHQYGWNREKLAELKSVLVPDLGLGCTEILALLPHMWNGFDLQNEQLPDGKQNPAYFSCACLGYQITEAHTNQILMDDFVLPLMRGYVKELHGVQREDNEPKGHQPFPDQVEATKRNIAYIWHELSQMPVEDRVHYIIQFYVGIKECVVGQKGALDTVATNLLLRHKKGDVENAESLAYFIKQNFIAAKEQAFVAAVNHTREPAPEGTVDDDGDVVQFLENKDSVHLVDHYRLQLAGRLGLSEQLILARDPYGVNNIDPHEGNLAHALQQFYRDFTPEDYVWRIMGLIETKRDRWIKIQVALGLKPELVPQVKVSRTLRPLTVNSFVMHFLDAKLLQLSDLELEQDDEKALWPHYFTHNPDDEPKKAQVTFYGVMKILIHMGLVAENSNNVVRTY